VHPSEGITMNTTVNRVRSGAVGLALAGLLFVFYEAAAPRRDETTLDGAEAWTSAAWAAAHLAAVLGLILIPLAWGALRRHLDGTRAEPAAYRATLLGAVGSGLTITYYGAETYGLKAIGERALADGDASLTEVGEAFRMDPTALTIFLIGLALVAVAAVLAAAAVWRSTTMHRWSAVPMAVAMVTFVPHFFLPHPARIAWGALVTLGALWIAVELWRAAAKAPETAS
jgi:hypothetical protein